MDFLVDLMEHFGLLVVVPGSDPQQWMLPMRLPERNVVLATATAQGAFAAFLSEIASRSQAGSEGLDLHRPPLHRWCRRRSSLQRTCATGAKDLTAKQTRSSLDAHTMTTA